MATNPSALRMQEVLGGEQTLGQCISNEYGFVDMVRSGLPYSALESLMELVGLSTDAVSDSLAIPRRTLARRKEQARLSAVESDRLVRLARVVTFANEVLGDIRTVSAWMRKPNRALGDATPLSRMDTDVGVRQVESVLGRIAHGVVS